MTHLANQPLNRRSPPAAAIEWEDTPSLAHLVAPPGARAASWDDTRPATLEELRPLTPMREPLPGLDVLESSEPEIFRLFFGASAAR